MREMSAIVRDDDNSQFYRAFSYLFPHEQGDREDLLKCLTFDRLKEAYRRGAKAYHPDSVHAPGKDRTSGPDRFVEIQEAYELLSGYLRERAEPLVRKSGSAKKIIAVGGAKGGIGKSIFVANLGIILSSKGFRTVLVDLDLGGANLHLYLGNRALLKRTVNDFLRRRAATLQEIMVESGYGPLLVGGDSSELGAANIEFARKLRLIKAIGGIEADYIVIDLGGDTSFNTVDFFLMADYAIVLTTPESASYIGSYHFLKAALYRKLHRLAGPESRVGGEEEKGLEKLIRDLTLSPEGPQVRSMADLIDHVRVHQPMNLSVLMKTLSDFAPHLVVNKVSSELEATRTAARIQDVSRKWLSREVRYLGSLSEQAEVGKSSRDLVPVVARYPRGRMAEEVGTIARRLLSFA